MNNVTDEHIDVLNNVVNVWLECGRRRRDYHEIGCVLLSKYVPVLTIDVLQIAEYCIAHVRRSKSMLHHFAPTWQNRDISRLYSLSLLSRI